MPSINFYLKSQKTTKNNDIPIIAQINLDYRKFRRQVEKTKKRYWNSKSQRVTKPKPGEPYNRFIEINELLEQYERNAKDFFSDNLKNGIELDADMVNEFLKKGKTNSHIDLTFFKAFDEFLNFKKADSAERTVTGYTTIKNFLKDFEKETGYKVMFGSINMSFYDHLKLYSFEVRKTSDNYFAKIIAVLKAFMNWSIEREYTTNSIYRKFKAVERQKEVIFLTMDELITLLNFEFQEEAYKKARDIYCFGCFTGLRISDINQLTRDHIVGDQIVKKIQKTQKVETIPINKFAKQILDKYKGSFKALPSMAPQYVNFIIKKCCKKAGIDSPLTIIEHRGGNTTEITQPKYKFITLHTARKTFVTNSLILGMNVKTIKDITGHVKDETFNRYLKIVEDFKKAEMDKTWNKI